MTLPTISAPYRDINNLLYQSYLPKIINTAVDAGVFETLVPDALPLEALSEALAADRGVLEALLQVLVRIDLLEFEGGRYSLSGPSRGFLLKDAPASQLWEVGRYSGSAGPFDNLAKALTGEKQEFSMDMWSSKEMAACMEQGAKAGSLQAVVSFMEGQPEFPAARLLCDYAGNVGYYSHALMAQNSDLHCHVYDLPGVCDMARELKKEAPHADRVTYHPCDPQTGEVFSEGYDIFFVSHFLYHYGVNGELCDFLQKVHRALKPGGIFVSHHLFPAQTKEDRLSIALVELQTRAMGYPTHQLPEEVLKKALSETGFDNVTTADTGRQTAFPALLLAARKV